MNRDLHKLGFFVIIRETLIELKKANVPMMIFVVFPLHVITLDYNDLPVAFRVSNVNLYSVCVKKRNPAE